MRILQREPELAASSVRPRKVPHRTFVELFRYGVLGMATNLLGYGIYLLITYCGVEPKITVSILYPAGAIIGFYGSKRWIFAHKGSVLQTSLRYCAAHVVGYLMNIAVLYIFVDELGYPHQLIQVIAVFLVAAFLFATFKFFVFPKEGNGTKVSQ